MSVRDGRISAMRHRSEFHPDWPVQQNIYVEGHTCRWGDTPWGAGRNETCSEVPTNRGMCNTHASREFQLQQRGTCDWRDGECWNMSLPNCLLCSVHAAVYAAVKGVSVTAVRSGKVPYFNTVIPPLRKTRPRKPDGDPIPGAKHGTWRGYNKDLCRCGACKEAASEFRRVARYKRLSRGGK